MRLGPRAAWLLGGVLGLAVRLLFLTVRIQDSPRSAAYRRGGPARRRGIFVLWHAHQLGAIWHFRGLGVATLASRHRDAEYVARFATGLGYVVARGSSTRGGGSGYRRLRAYAEAGRPVAITPDGPRGPQRVMKAGAVHLAAATGWPLVPLCVGYSDFWTLGSWDGFRIPKPFARGYAAMGAAVAPPRKTSPGEVEPVRRTAEERLRALEPVADARARALRGKRP